MDAPTYPPATAFEPPATAPVVLGVATASLADLMNTPGAWEIAVKHAPALKMAVAAPQLKPQLGNFTVDSFITFGVVSQKAVDEIDAELRKLPADGAVAR
jgi:hypothetical protein